MRSLGQQSVLVRCTPEELSRTVKAQWIRVVDVFLIGPLMVAGGLALWRRHPVWGGLLTLFGFGTVAFNGVNWWRVRAVQGLRSVA